MSDNSKNEPVTPISPLLHTLARRDRISAKDRTILEELPFGIRTYRREEEIITAGSRPEQSCLVVQGFTARVNSFEDGTRQVTGLYIPGDFVDLHALLLRTMDHSVVALSPCVAAFTSHRDLRRVVDQAPHLTRLFWLTTVIDAAIQRTWIANYSRRPSLLHLAHFVCEIYLRLEAAGMVDGDQFDLDITQQQLSEVMGLSPVHMNRTVQKLRQTQLVSWTGSRVHIADFRALARFASFDPLYLSLSREPR
ncbi:Crp/Fnr family transcriptional regulator [Neoroseomonas terrae]|uniref:Crp/Fnr family transcriptional regulator n=1 Tax=Neoroseomonas terrae TaxID=424799 RepID=UPI001FE5ED7D|nr:Crp/Fnr family transcriptional regulator [Neoroseomonas terrae]